MSPKRIKDGFAGQRFLSLPENIIAKMKKADLTQTLYTCNIGYFPNASYHYIDRPKGIESYILIYCTTGQGWYKVKQKQLIKAGQYFILPANQHHSYGADLDYPWTIHWCHIAGQTAGNIWNHYRENHFPYASVPFSQKRILLFEQIYNLLEKGYSKEHLDFASLTTNYLISSFLYPKLFDPPQENQSTDMTDIAIDYMKDNLSQSITLKELADHISYSPPHLISEFKKKTGYSPIDYHNRLRIQKACQYLDLTNTKIKEISYLLGFNDPYYFSRLFTKIIGKSPKAYKNRE